MTTDSDTEALSPRRLTVSDVASGCRLSTQAGWNQTELDWQLMIESGQGIGFVDPDDNLIATAILVPYQSNIDWVSMIIVDEAWRGRGLGLRLTRLIVELSPHPLLGLDATEMGYPIYEKLGFSRSESITRFARSEKPGADPYGTSQIASVSIDGFSDSLNHFIRASGSSRVETLCALGGSDGGRLRMTREDKTVAVALVREGRVTKHVGPLLATDVASVSTLLRWIGSSISAPITIDVFDRHEALGGELAKLGFEPARQFIRMFRGGLPPPNPREYAVTGPELG